MQNQLSSKITAIRKRHALSQRQAAAMGEISHRTLRFWERGEVEPSAVKLDRYLKALGETIQLGAEVNIDDD